MLGGLDVVCSDELPYLTLEFAIVKRFRHTDNITLGFIRGPVDRFAIKPLPNPIIEYRYCFQTEKGAPLQGGVPRQASILIVPD
jgi:hypothetical protein